MLRNSLYPCMLFWRELAKQVRIARMRNLDLSGAHLGVPRSKSANSRIFHARNCHCEPLASRFVPHLFLLEILHFGPARIIFSNVVEDGSNRLLLSRRSNHRFQVQVDAFSDSNQHLSDPSFDCIVRTGDHLLMNCVAQLLQLRTENGSTRRVEVLGHVLEEDCSWIDPCDKSDERSDQVACVFIMLRHCEPLLGAPRGGSCDTWKPTFKQNRP